MNNHKQLPTAPPSDGLNMKCLFHYENNPRLHDIDDVVTSYACTWELFSKGNKHVTFKPSVQSSVRGIVIKFEKNKGEKLERCRELILPAIHKEFLPQSRKICLSQKEIQFCQIFSAHADGDRLEPHCFIERDCSVHSRVELTALGFGSGNSRAHIDFLGMEAFPGNSDGNWSDQHSGSLCVEIKPKCGLSWRVPLAMKPPSVKASYSRFAYMQLYKRIERARKDKKKELDELSRFEPADIFSGSQMRISRSIQQLMEVPNKYFKLFSIDRDGHWEKLTEVSDFAFGKLLPDILSTVLRTETLLSELLELQSLDLIDDEGLAILWRKGVSILSIGEGCSEWEKSDEDEMQVAKQQLCARVESRLLELCDLIDVGKDVKCELTRSLFDSSAPFICRYDSIFGSDACDACVQWLEDRDIDDIVTLLAMWLVALTARDVSVMVSLDDWMYSQSIPFEDSSSLSFDVVKLPLSPALSDKSNSAGVGVVKVLQSNGDVVCCCSYILSVVDVHVKPVSKLLEHVARDSAISRTMADVCT